MNFMRRRRRSTSATVFLPVAAILIVAFSTLGVSSFLRIMYIEVVGASRYSEEEIIFVSGISTAKNLLFLDKSAIEGRIRSEMPYISSVIITRVIPDTIWIDITESTALAMIRFKDETLVIDSSGRVLERLEVPPAGLVEVRGFTPVNPEIGSAMKAEPSGETRLQYLTDVLKAMERADICDDVSYLDVSNIVGINFWYIDRFEVTIGGSGNVQQKLGRLPQIVEKINEDYGVEETGRISMSDSSSESRFYLYR